MRLSEIGAECVRLGLGEDPETGVKTVKAATCAPFGVELDYRCEDWGKDARAFAFQIEYPTPNGLKSRMEKAEKRVGKLERLLKKHKIPLPK